MKHTIKVSNENQFDPEVVLFGNKDVREHLKCKKIATSNNNIMTSETKWFLAD